jgi:hypothetical protein
MVHDRPLLPLEDLLGARWEIRLDEHSYRINGMSPPTRLVRVDPEVWAEILSTEAGGLRWEADGMVMISMAPVWETDAERRLAKGVPAEELRPDDVAAIRRIAAPKVLGHAAELYRSALQITLWRCLGLMLGGR